MDLLKRLVGSPAIRRWAVASLVANMGIVVTGALVRLTGSGLGCPTWPKCSDASYVTHPALGLHGAIEFGNRLLTFVLVIIAVLTWVSALMTRTADGAKRRDLRWIAAGLALGIPAQAVIGGISVLTQLNPYVVALHLLVSMVLIAVSVWLVRRSRDLRPDSDDAVGRLGARVAFVFVWVAVWIGTMVTGSGPHAGDENAPRNGLDGSLLTHLHAAMVYVAVAATMLAVWRLRSRAAVLLLVAELGQAAVGIAQYRLGLPIGLVLVHLAGASLTLAAATNLMLSVHRSRSRQESPVGEAALVG